MDFTKELTTIDGKVIPYSGKPKMTLMDISLDALLASLPDEQNLSGEEKAKRYVLATRIYTNPTSVDLKAEEITLIKKLVGRVFGPLVVGQAFEMLENKPVNLKKTK